MPEGKGDLCGELGPHRLGPLKTLQVDADDLQWRKKGLELAHEEKFFHFSTLTGGSFVMKNFFEQRVCTLHLVQWYFSASSRFSSSPNACKQSSKVQVVTVGGLCVVFFLGANCSGIGREMSKKGSSL